MVQTTSLRPLAAYHSASSILRIILNDGSVDYLTSILTKILKLCEYVFLPGHTRVPGVISKKHMPDYI